MRPTLTPSSALVHSAPLTRSEIAALRARAQGLTPEQIASRYTDGKVSAINGILERALNILHQHGLAGPAGRIRNGTGQSAEAVSKALVAIRDLEKLGSAPPSLIHPTHAWFVAYLCKRMAAAKINTIEDLIKTMNDHGTGWWRRIDGFGRKAGWSITDWVRKHSQTLGMEVREFIKTPTLQLADASAKVLIFHETPALAPLERLSIKEALSGAKGENRAPLAQCRLYASNDHEAISTWLSLYPVNSHTFRSYRKEAERFLLWSVVIKGKAMSSVFVEDVIEYREFLKDPRPAFSWVGPVNKRFSKDWRPFQGPLSHTSQAHAITILKSMFEWLKKQNYLSTNPFDALPKNNRPSRIMVEKALSLGAWQSVYDWGIKQDKDTFVTALAFLTLMRDCGMRRTEVTHLTRRCLVFNEGWKATFEGKGARIRTVPVSKSAIRAIEAHLATREFTLETMEDSAPLIKPKTYLKDQADRSEMDLGYTEQGLWRIIKAFFKAYTAANGAFEGRDLSTITPHALRHTFGVNAIEKGVPIDVVQQTLGHASLSTTTIYSQGDIKRRTKELNKLFEE